MPQSVTEFSSPSSRHASASLTLKLALVFGASIAVLIGSSILALLANSSQANGSVPANLSVTSTSDADSTAELP